MRAFSQTPSCRIVVAATAELVAVLSSVATYSGVNHDLPAVPATVRAELRRPELPFGREHARPPNPFGATRRHREPSGRGRLLLLARRCCEARETRLVGVARACGVWA